MAKIGVFLISGVGWSEKSQKKGRDEGTNSDMNLLKDEDVEIVEIDGKMVVAINVPRADYTIRPVYINNN